MFGIDDIFGVASGVAGLFGGGGDNQQEDQYNAAKQASGISAEAAKAGIDEQRTRYDQILSMLSPYVNAGTRSIEQQQAMIGLRGSEAQRGAISGIENSPYFQSLVQQGENSILQNGSATGGLRGGNIQAALAQFRPQMLNNLIEQQYSRLGGLTSLGQNTVTNQAGLTMQSADSISNLMANVGQAQASGALAEAYKPYTQGGSLIDYLGKAKDAVGIFSDFGTKTGWFKE